MHPARKLRPPQVFVDIVSVIHDCPSTTTIKVTNCGLSITPIVQHFGIASAHVFPRVANTSSTVKQDQDPNRVKTRCLTTWFAQSPREISREAAMSRHASSDSLTEKRCILLTFQEPVVEPVQLQLSPGVAVGVAAQDESGDGQPALPRAQLPQGHAHPGPQGHRLQVRT